MPDFTVNVNQLLGDYSCEWCGRPVYYNSHRWLHNDDQTPADNCTGYPRTNVNVLDRPH